MTAGPPARTYREMPPPAALSPLLECFWRREPWTPPEHDLGVLPDGRVDLLWAESGEALVIGPQTRALGRPVPPRFAVVGARFRPGVGPALLGVAGREIVDSHVPLDAIDSGPAARLRRDIARSTDDPPAAPAVIARALATLADGHRGVDRPVLLAASLLERPGATVAVVARDVGLSVRQLERRFRETVGYGPKALQRVLRFQRVLEALGAGRGDAGGLARIAVDAGYADQAHLTRETRELSGLTPLGLERALAALRAEGASGIFKTRGREVGRLRPRQEGEEGGPGAG